MTHGQVEVSFQWVFALIAGIALLTVLLFGLRSCNQSGEERVSAVASRSAASTISGLAWRTQNASISLPNVAVSCPASTLTLSSSGASTGATVSQTLDRVPAFLSPTLGGRNTVVVRDVMLPAEPPMTLGAVLYSLSERTEYYFIANGQPAIDARSEVLRVLNLQPSAMPKNVHLTAPVSPLTTDADSVILVQFVSGSATAASAVPGVVALSGKGTLYRVGVSDSQVAFAQGSDVVGTPVSIKGPYLKAGAAVAGRLDTFSCARSAFAERAKTLTQVWEKRAKKLGESGAIPTTCAVYMNVSVSNLTMINAAGIPDAYLKKILDTTDMQVRNIINAQTYLYTQGCPVIA